KYSKERQQEHINQIRRVLVIKPDSSILEIKDALEKQRVPLKLDKNYINRLVNKIRKERAKRFDYYTVNKVLAGFQDEIEELKKRLWIIITDQTTTATEKTMAIRELRNSDKDLFDKMFDAGIFERKLGEMEIKGELKDEDKELINKAIDYARGTKRKNNKQSDIQETTGN
ncbi:MAG: hypothetical protein PHQ76_06555, partial [Caldisericia bacterium]|nr:hypothetical protein [Caldisericia bacterium]